MERKIDYRFKLLYALAMFMIVSGHVGGGGISLLGDWFPYYGHHVAIFVFGSGYFYRKASEEHVGAYTLKKIKTLVIPLYLYTIVYGIIVQILHRYGFPMGDEFSVRNVFLMPVLTGHQFVYNLGAWFVAPFFMVQIFYVLVRKAVRKINIPEWMYFILFTGLGLGGNLLACRGYYEGWWLVLDRMLYFLIFYALGVFYRSTLEEYDRKIPNVWYFAFLFGMQLVIACIYGKIPVYTPSWCYDFTDGPFMPALLGYVGIAFWFRVSVILEPVLGRSRCINLIADNTFSIMMNHLMGVMLVKGVYGFLSVITPFFNDFDWDMFRTKFWWLYVPGGVEQTMIIYIAAGIGLPVLFQLLLNKVKNGMKGCSYPVI